MVSYSSPEREQKQRSMSSVGPTPGSEVVFEAERKIHTEGEDVVGEGMTLQCTQGFEDIKDIMKQRGDQVS